MLSPRPRILVVDDDQNVLALLARLGASEGFDVATTLTRDDALHQLRATLANLVLLDLQMPCTQGLQTLHAIREASPRSRVALMTGYGTIESAVEAVKLGATDYLAKPFDLSRVRALLREVRDQRTGIESPHGGWGSDVDFCGMVGHSPAMREVFGLLRRLAPHARTTLITGETGTGKELAARALHALGPRSQRRMVTVNCSAVVEALFESELFGHVRGAFTGATEHKAGLFETADGGTLFLDEVGELPAAAQAKLLRVLEGGEVQRVGSLEPRCVDVRLIAATNRDLYAEVTAGRFRSDLYYRLNVVQVHLPPLRARREDIPDIARSLVATLARKLGRPLTGLTPGAEAMLSEYAWEGNVRQLRNAIERACILADGDRVTESELAGSVGRADGPDARFAPRFATITQMPKRQTARLDEVEREHIVRTLNQVHGNKAVAARLLGVSRRAFYRQLERHGLHRRVPVTASLTVDLAPSPALGRAS